MGLSPQEFDNITPAELDYLYFHHSLEQRRMALAGWYAGISTGQIWLKKQDRQSFDQIYPDPLKGTVPKRRPGMSYEDWKAKQEAKGFVDKAELGL